MEISPNIASTMDRKQLSDLEIHRRAMAAKKTDDWLDLFEAVCEQAIFKQCGNDMEPVRKWRSDWKVARRELKAIELNIMEDVEIEDPPLEVPTATGVNLITPPTGTKFYWPSRGQRPLVVRDRPASMMVNFFKWFMSFQDTLGQDPKARTTTGDAAIMRQSIHKPGINLGS